jgi:tetratricopeptide (TPR) repeat protein
VDDAVAKTRALLPLERDFQKKAIEAYLAAYEGGALDRKLAPEVAYLLGELHRRTGDAAAALTWYGKAIESSDSEPLKKLAAEQKARTGKP